MIATANEAATQASSSGWFMRLAGAREYTEEFPFNVGGIHCGILRLEMSERVMMQALWHEFQRVGWSGIAYLAGIVRVPGLMLDRQADAFATGDGMGSSSGGGGGVCAEGGIGQATTIYLTPAAHGGKSK